MQPENSYQPAPTGIDYLYQIAPPSPGPKKQSKVIIGIMLFIGIALIATIFTIATSQPDQGPTPIKLAARLQKMQTISQKYSKKLRTTAMQDINSSLSAVLITANQSITAPLAAYEVDPKKQTKDIAALDPSAEIEKKLDDAFLNSQLDSTYAIEMYFQIEDTLVMIDRLYSKTRVASMREFMEKTYEDLDHLRERLSKFKA